MAGAPPTPGFAAAVLDIASIDAGSTFVRIRRKAYPDPLGFGKHATRFSDPRRRAAASRFGVLYLGSSLKVCFLEAILRDYRDGVVGDVEIAEAEMHDRLCSEVRTRAPLRLIDLRDEGPVRMGIPSDVVRGRAQTLARQWSIAIYRHPDTVDGVIYPSRLNNETNLAIYDRAVSQFTQVHSQALRTAPGIADLMDDFRVALI